MDETNPLRLRPHLLEQLVNDLKALGDAQHGKHAELGRGLVLQKRTTDRRELKLVPAGFPSDDRAESDVPPG